MPIVWEAVGATALPFLGSVVNGRFLTKEIPGWYDHLKKPWWTPPNYVFGPVWTGLYTSMGYASYLVWRDGGGFSGDARLPLAIYGSQLVLNWIWPAVFFGRHNTKWGFWNILAVLGGATASAVTMSKVNEVAGYLMTPYVAWLSLATSLSFYVWRHNPTGEIPRKLN